MTEQRTHERISCKFRTFYQTDQTPTWWWCTVEDLSSHGLRLRTARVIHRGMSLEFDLSLAEPRRARVVHLEREDTVYHAGCTFLRELTSEELATLERLAAGQRDTWQPSE